MRYIVLRDLRRERGDTGPGWMDLSGRRDGVLEPPQLRIEAEDTDIRGSRDIAAEPDVKGIALMMPTRLIAPLDATAECEDGDSWGVTAVGASRSRYTGDGTVVAVLDTGIKAQHEAFAGINVVQKDFTGSGNKDRHGHGTHCAGTIFGQDVHGSRIGIARGVRDVLVGKILSDTGAGTSEMAFRGLWWAAENGAHVISMSLGFDFPGMVDDKVKRGWPPDVATSLALEAYRGTLRMFDALMKTIKERESFSPSCVAVAAAGNESRRDVNPEYEIAVSLPAAADGVLSTGALGRSPVGYTIAPFSNSLPKLCAPGVGIKSACASGGLQSMSGTSMACPHVAGVAALEWEAARTTGMPATADNVRARILARCRLEDLAPDTDAAGRGNGIVTAP